MHPLTIKLFRDLYRLWPQALAIAFVMAAGVATLILATGAHRSLSQTRAAYYEANRFADIFAEVTRAPASIAAIVEAMDGVAAVETRISKLAIADVPGMAEPAALFLVSVPELHAQRLNRIYLREGRLPQSGSKPEAVISEGFANAHRLRPGDEITVLINGRKRQVAVAGIGLSPEFIYAIGPWDLMPDNRRFGIAWLPQDTLAAAFDLDGAFSAMAVKLLPGANQAAFIDRLDQLLGRYGGTGAHGRKDQISHAFLDAELKQLEAMGRILPPIFLLVAAFLVNITLMRLVTLEREQIGLLKAIGYGSWDIALHYIGFVALIAAIGIAIGFGAGTWLGAGMARLYAKFFNFPFLVFSRSIDVYAISAMVTLAAAIAGAARAVAGVAFLPPAVAMAPPAPVAYHKLLPAGPDLSRLFGQAQVIAARHLIRWPGRTFGSIIGIAFGVAILVGSLWSFGSVERMIEITYIRSDRQDASINFGEARPQSALFEIRRLPGVIQAEPYRTVPVKIRNGPRERRILLAGKPPYPALSRVLDTALEPIAFPDAGIVLTTELADILGVRLGEVVEIEVMEGKRATLAGRVSAIHEGYLGLTAYMEIGALNRLLGEGDVISGVHVQLDAAGRDEFLAAAKATPSANFVALQKVSLKRFRETLAQNINIMVTVYVCLAAIIAFGVVYNFTRISLSEQGRELASLRVIGFTRAEVSGLLLSELFAIVLIAQPVGWLVGYGFALAMVQGFSTELYRVPLVVNTSVYAWASIVVIAAALLSALLVRRRIDRLDLVAVLKTRE
jgi:putative ABC transport system permease protein